jgi:hypothetical protein
MKEKIERLKYCRVNLRRDCNERSTSYELEVLGHSGPCAYRNFRSNGDHVVDGWKGFTVLR